MRYPEFFRARRAYPVAALVFVFILLTTAFAPMAQAAPQGPWVLPADDLSQAGEHSYDTQVAVADDGTATAVWSRSNGIHEVIQASRRPPGGSWGPPEKLSSGGSDSGDPRIAVGPDGTVTVVWLQEDGLVDAVMSSTYPPGAGFGQVEEMSTTGLDARDPRIAIGGDGTATAIWTEFNGSNYWVKTRTRPPGGSFATAEFLSSGGQDSRDASVVVGPGGTTTAIWRRDDGTGDHIVQTRIKPKGGSYGLSQNLSVSGQNSNRPRLAVGPDGSIVAIWARDNGTNYIIQTRSRPATGIFGPVQNLSSGGEDGSDPRVTVGADGTTTAVWFRSSGPNDIIQARVRPPNEAFGPVEDVTGVVVIAGDLGIASAPDGTSSIVWYSKVGANYVVQAATQPPGADFGPTEILSAPGANTSYPDIAIGPDGVATAVWTRYDGSRDIAQAASTLAASALSVTREGSGTGTVTSAPAGIDCGPVCAGLFSFYAPVTLTARPAVGSTFTGWSGDCAGPGATCQLDLGQARAATAGFAADPSVCPPRKLKLKKLRRNRKKGIGKLTIKAGGKGKVVLKGSKKVRKFKRKVGKKGKGKIRIKPRGKAAKRLRKKGKVKIKVKLVYRPGGDCPNKKTTRKVKLVRKK